MLKKIFYAFAILILIGIIGKMVGYDPTFVPTEDQKNLREKFIKMHPELSPNTQVTFKEQNMIILSKTLEENPFKTKRDLAKQHHPKLYAKFFSCEKLGLLSVEVQSLKTGKTLSIIHCDDEVFTMEKKKE